MDKRLLVMKWDYKYDKESTWFDEDSGEERYELIEGASYTLPHISKKSLEIRSVKTEGDLIHAEIYVDHHTYTVRENGEPVVGYAYYDYSVAGDSVSQTLCMDFSIA
ncbi:MAG: hypothetical protein E7618_06095 [Ruminococcaceae bacterium]|nr:hypothetical protein [Oscillospiraceae bacterium]